MTALSPWASLLNHLQLRNNYAVQPAGLKWRSSTLFILSTIAVAMFTDLFLYGLLVPVLPFMLEELIGLPESRTQSYTSFLLAAYAGSSVLASPVAGVLADRISSRQAPFLLGLATLLGATVLLFLGRTVPILVLARVLQGVSSGLVWTLGLALCIETVGPANLGKTVGTLFSFISAGSIWGPFVGGLLYEKAGYGGVFAVSFAVLGLDMIMRALMIEKKVAYRYETGDPKSNFTPGDPASASNDDQENEEVDGTNEEQPLLPKDKQDESATFRLPENPSRLARAIPILPCLRNPALLTSLWLALVQATLFGSCDATITTVSRELFGFDSLKAGLLFLPQGLVDLAVGPVAGWIVDRKGTKIVAIASFLFMVPVLVLLRVPHAGGADQIALYAFLLALLGIGLSGSGTPSVVESGAVVEKYHEYNKDFFGERGPYAQLYGLNSMMFNLGLTIGPELAGELKQAIGYGNMNIVLAVMSGVSAILSFLYIGGPPKLWTSKRD